MLKIVTLRRKIPGLVLAMVLLLQMAAGSVSPARADSPSAFASFASGAFRKVWERPDLPVAVGKASRSFTWGPQGWAFREEPYTESPGSKRLVQYFDKTRMELTNPAADPNGTYYVTNGLLVKEMVAGRLQEGNDKFRNRAASDVPVAGDPQKNPGPTYRSFQGVASLNLDKKAPRQVSALVKTTLNREGKVGESNELATRYGVKYTEYNPELGHNIADVFWNFMLRQGEVFQDSDYKSGPVIEWVATMGFPLTEAYWSRVVVAGKEKDVLIQLFERRVLTFTPDNSDEYKVEMGNVGAHYYTWRYPGEERKAPWANVKIINESSCGTITAAFTGQDNLTIDIAANSTKTYRFGPGTYTLQATGCNSAPYKESVTLLPDGADTFTFFLRAV